MISYGSLFSGVGGFDLGFDRSGMQCAWQVEIDPHAQQVLQKHWPDVPKHTDIKDCGAHNLKQVDVICGGFPCQDLSVAGNRAGLEGNRSGLFYEMMRIVAEVNPQTVVIENVPGLLSGSDEIEVDNESCICGWNYRWGRLPNDWQQAESEKENLLSIDSNRDDVASNCGSPEASKPLRGKPSQVQTEEREVGGSMALDVAPESRANCIVGERGISLGNQGGTGCNIDEVSGIESRREMDVGRNEESGREDETENSRAQQEGPFSRQIGSSGRGEAYCPCCGRGADGIASGSVCRSWIFTVLRFLSTLGYSAEWAIVDSQNFGVPQRRRRIFIVGHLGKGCCGKVFFKPKGMCRNPPSRKEAGKGSAGDVAACINSGGNVGGFRTEPGEHLIVPDVAATLRGRSAASEGVNMPGRGGEDDVNLIGYQATGAGYFREGGLACSATDQMGPKHVVAAVTSKWAKGSGGPDGDECQNVVIDWQNCTASSSVVSTLNASSDVYCFEQNQRDEVRLTEVAGAVKAEPGMKNQSYLYPQVRRLTPTECQRLQGFPDDWLNGQSDTQKYKQCGNAVTVNVAEWIGRRIADVM